MRTSTLTLSVLVGVVCGVFVYGLSFSYFEAEELQKLQGRLSLYKNSLDSQIERFSYLPYVLSQDPYVIRGAQGEGLYKLNERLEEMTRKAKVEAIYLMNTDGLTIASSNYNKPKSYIGQNYGFRPYFRDALKGKRGEFYGIGATTKLPGLFISEPVRNSAADIVGIIAIKINFEDLQSLWVSAGEQVLLSNRDHVVLLASEPSWRYKTLYPLTPDKRRDINQEQQFANEPLNDLNWRVLDDNQAIVRGTYFLMSSTELESRGWRLYFFAGTGVIHEKTWFTLISILVVLSIAFGWRQTRKTKHIGEELKVSKADFAELRKANQQLAVEIDERRAAEDRLRAAQNELSRASRLAALGQLSVSVTHELGQPLAAMRNYLMAAELSDHPPATGFMNKMNGLALRMENITKQLRFFATPGSDRFDKVDLRDVVYGVEELLSADIKAMAVQYEQNLPDAPVYVRANRLRLEQVLTNLMRNALNAMEDEAKRCLTVSLDRVEARGRIVVSDSGVGLGVQTLEQLQEPFMTTRRSGGGLGLGLAISAEIVKEHDGQMEAHNRAVGGAEFIIELPLEEQV